MNRILLSLLLLMVSVASCGRHSSAGDGTGLLRHAENVRVPVKDTLTLPVCHVDREVDLEFTLDGRVGTVALGRGYGRYNGGWIRLTEDSMWVLSYHSKEELKAAFAHRLLLEGKTRIVMHTDLDSTSIVLENASGTFSTPNLAFVFQGKPFVHNISAEEDLLSFVSLSSPTLNEDLWLFGDSYLSCTTDYRWLYYPYHMGGKNWMAEHLSGGGSRELLDCLKEDLKLRRPKIAVWTLGMNDGTDSKDGIPQVWTECVQAFIGLCRENDIEPVLATIPTVPGRNHEQKNAFVRSSGLRFIDFAEAVGADASGNWLPGLIYQDNVHPNQQGAKTLADRAMKDLPELLD